MTLSGGDSRQGCGKCTVCSCCISELNESPELDIIVACNLVDFSSFWLWGYRAAVSKFTNVKLSCGIKRLLHSKSSSRYKVHYVGYSSKDDEWKVEGDLVPIDEEREESKCNCYYS